MSNLDLVTVFLTITVLIVCWAIWEFQSEKIRIIENSIIKNGKGTTKRLKLSDLKEIKYHYHAVVGFIAVWEFIDIWGNSITIDAEARGMQKTLVGLESALPGFSLEYFKRQFEAGDVEDTLEIWKNA